MFGADGNVLAALLLFTTGLGSLGLLGAGAGAGRAALHPEPPSKQAQK
jgi:hypothetical protein